MTIFQKSWWNRAASNVGHTISSVVTGIEHNVGGVLGSVESHVKADVVQAVNGAATEVNHLAGLAASTTTTLATGAESTLKVSLMIAAVAGGIYLVMMKGKPM